MPVSIRTDEGPAFSRYTPEPSTKIEVGVPLVFSGVRAPLICKSSRGYYWSLVKYIRTPLAFLVLLRPLIFYQKKLRESRLLLDHLSAGFRGV